MEPIEYQEDKTNTTGHLRKSYSIVQSRPSDTYTQEFLILNQKVQGLKSEKNGEEDQENDRKGYPRVLPAGNMAPWIILQNNPRTPPVPSWHGKEDMPVTLI